ncbi:DUF1698 domain-containing protein [Anatilimnocola floriformis]|uniref:DUF1698 domain-containing protein n=1 Tax=Anatilimnocola floriformis TaxID=2948575 RepID=UPI0020C3012B|nr:DUF1698 domain-containing protein [Anatilimnocola floriformis]
MNDTAQEPTLAEKVASYPFWYHRVELPGGVTTPGWAPLNAKLYGIPADLTGKRVLDVGAWDGYWTFEAIKRGATEVVAIDDFSDYLGTLNSSDRKAWETFDLCREAFGYDSQKCHREEISVYDVTEARFGRFDVVFCFGVIYHLRHPLLALDRLAAVCNEEIFLESAILDDFSPYRGGIGKGYSNNDVVMEFYPGNEYGNNTTNWWCPTLSCLAALLNAAGFNNVRTWKLVGAPKRLPDCRGFANGKR